jgi:YD repeat-containing protein
LAGNLSRITWQGGERDGQWALQATSALEYDDAGRLASIDHEFAPFTSYTYAYDEASRITEFNTLMGAATADSRGYEYDDAGQLTAATGDADESYAYDSNGNRTTADGRTVVTDAANRVVSDGTYYYEYDAEGNRTRRTELATGQATCYEWDYRNRLVEVRTCDQTSTVADFTTTVPYAGQAGNGSLQVLEDGRRIELTGNICRAWHLPATYTITADTYIEFDYKSDVGYEGLTGPAGARRPWMTTRRRRSTSSRKQVLRLPSLLR